MNRQHLLVFLLCASITLAASITHEFQYTTDAVEIGTDRGYTTVDYAGAPHIDNLGMPDLPAMVYHVAIPPTAEVTGFEITSIEEEPLKGDYDVLPVQHPVPWRADAPVQPFVPPDPAFYSDEAPYPKEPAGVGTAGSKSGYRIVDFCVYPVRYNPVKRTLSLVRNIAVKLSYETGRHHVARYTKTQNAIHGSHVAGFVLNPDDVHRFAPPTRSQSHGSTFLPAAEFEHVIITRSAWADSLQRLADWRTRQGWRSKVVHLESICAVYPGRDTAEQMRNFLKDADTTWGTIFAFIARDDYPASQYRLVSAFNTIMKSDMYFSDLDGDWDANGNGTFGENADSVDAYADVFVGMITLNGFTELTNYLGKLFRYELSPDTTADWVTRCLLPNGVTFSNQYNDSVANATPTPPWFDLKMYSTGGVVTPSPGKYCDSVNSGYGLTSVIGHGSPNLMQLGGNVTSSMMIGLTNANRMGFGTFVCCETGEWDLGSTNGDCFAENITFHAPNGYVAICMNDKSGWVAVAELLNYAICYGALGHRTSRRPTTGEALSFGKDYWVFRIKDSAKFRMELFERNLFGEPAIPIWTGNPFTATVTKPGAINIGGNVPVQVTVSNGSAPVDSAMVCITKGDEVFDRGWTDASGQVTLHASALTPGTIQLTVTSANNIPYLDSIVAISSDRYVTYLRHSINDSPPGGDADGIINPGETVRIPTWLRNYGTQTASSVTAQLVCRDPGATITDSIKAFGSIAGNDSAQNVQGFELQAADGLANGYAIPCSLICKDASDSTWTSRVTFRVSAPLMSFVSRIIKDAGSANPNGKLDPGETAEIEVAVHNSGAANAYNVRGILRSADSRVTVPDSLALYGTVEIDSFKTNTTDHFSLTASPGIPKGACVTFMLEIHADGGYVSQDSFEITIGEILAVDPIPDGPRVPPLYWALDDKDSLYDQRPVYDWAEIKGLGTQINFANNDDVIAVDFPAAFGPFQYYGQTFTQISVSADGWLAPGYHTSSNYANTSLPSGGAPPGAICPNWDDLYPGYSSQGYVYYYHDTANHRFIVEYDSVSYYDHATTRDKFEVIFYDTTLAAADGNNVFTFQYMTADGFGSNTIGIQDPTKSIAIQALKDGTLDVGCYPLGPGRAIKFMTEEPTGIVEAEGSWQMPVDRLLAVAPNPFRRTSTIHWTLGRTGNADLRVFDAAGRSVRTLVSGQTEAGTYATTWDGLDNYGRRLARGIYFVRLTTPDTAVRVKAVLTD